MGDGVQGQGAEMVLMVSADGGVCPNEGYAKRYLQKMHGSRCNRNPSGMTGGGISRDRTTESDVRRRGRISRDGRRSYDWSNLWRYDAGLV